MTRERGRALIINNMNFDKRPDLCRQGSDGDTANMSAMLKDFKFDVVTHTDLKAEVYFYRAMQCYCSCVMMVKISLIKY